MFYLPEGKHRSDTGDSTVDTLLMHYKSNTRLATFVAPVLSQEPDIQFLSFVDVVHKGFNFLDLFNKD